MSYVVGTPATYGFAVRNGWTLADNAPEVMLSRAEHGRALGLETIRIRASPKWEPPVRRGGVTSQTEARAPLQEDSSNAKV